MKTLFGMMLLALAAVFAAPAQAQDLCADLVPEGENLVCNVDITLTETNGQTFAQQTFGIVQSVRVVAKLAFNPSKISEYLQESKISLPPQHVDFYINTNTGATLAVGVDIASYVTITGSPGSYTAVEGFPNITNVSGSLGSFVNNIVKNKLNTNEKLKDGLKKAGQKFLDKVAN